MGLLLRPQASFELACRIRSPAGAPLGEAFRFASGLYFRGKLAYADAFGRPPPRRSGTLVIVPGAGLAPATRPVTGDDLRAMARVPVDAAEPRYTAPLRRDVERHLVPHASAGRLEVVLLGSIASGKYVEVLRDLLPDLLFPTAFVGRGDLSRGGLLLRAAREGVELDYAPLAGAVRNGPRPPRLPRLRRSGPPPPDATRS